MPTLEKARNIGFFAYFRRIEIHVGMQTCNDGAENCANPSEGCATIAQTEHRVGLSRLLRF